MPAPYSEDLREKAIAALKTKSVTEVSEMLNIHRDTSRCGKPVLPQREVVRRNKAISKGIVTKSPTGAHFASLRKCTAIKLKLRWLNYGLPMLAKRLSLVR